MKISNFSLLFSFSILIVISHFSLVASAPKSQAFLQCLSHYSSKHTSISTLTYTQQNPEYSSVLNLTIINLRFSLPSTPKPFAIVTPLYESQIQPVIYCSKKNGFQIRLRSGGHDFEGLSHISKFPFIVIDLINLKRVNVDLKSQTAWVQSGVTTGELYTEIAKRSPTLTFPSAICISLGMGGYLSGGGYGALLRKYGLAGDNVIDARLIDANGRVLDRKSMGEDVFWAIRGGGGGSFGVVVAWKVKLVPVPKTVTVFRVQRSVNQNATEIVDRWQHVAPKLPRDLFIGAALDTTLNVSFFSVFLGRANMLIPIMNQRFPELGLVEKDCIEMSWVDAAITSLGAGSVFKRHFKAKSDYVREPIPVKGIEGIWKKLTEKEAQTTIVFLIPYGGRMDEFSESALPYPNRAGTLYKIQYNHFWQGDDVQVAERNIDWVRKMYEYMARYVSKNPRRAYINYRDLDLGVNNVEGNTSYAQASVWGRKYFNNNFYRLAKAKKIIDPTNFFRHEQSIPLL